MNRSPELYQYLPLYAKLAIERADCDSSKRNAADVTGLIHAYAQTYGEQPDEHIIDSTLYRCSNRFSDWQP